MTIDMPPESAGYPARGRWLVGRLMDDLSLTENQAAGIVGNLGFESGLKAIQEISPLAGRGGFGWAQWTGPRRASFEAWCHAEGLDVSSDEANYGYLLVDLHGVYSHTIDALRQTTTLYDAVFSVGQTYERPYGTTPNYLPGVAARYSYAQRAIGGGELASHKDRMRVMQTALKTLRLYDGEIDGLFGPKSRAALAAFQKEAG